MKMQFSFHFIYQDPRIIGADNTNEDVAETKESKPLANLNE